MSWFRSEPMQYVSLIVQEDAAAAVVDALGRMGVMQFTDMNPLQTAFQRRYSNEVKRCDELERKLRFLESELSKARIRSEESADVERFLAPPSSFVSPLVQQPRSSPLPAAAAAAAAAGSFGGARTLDTLTAIFEQRESDVKEMGSYFKNLTREYNAQVEARYVLQLGSTFFQSAVRNPDLDAALSGDSSSAASAAAASIRFSCIAGTISAEEKLNFERTAFRATRGNCLVRFVDIEGAIVDPQSGQDVIKSVFVVLFRSRTVEEKLVRVCNAFGARRYDVPNLDDPAAVTRRVAEISAEVDAKQQLLLQHRAHMTRMLGDIASRMQEWKWTVRREKAVYHTLNMFRADVSNMLRGEGWVIARAVDDVMRSVRSIAASSYLTVTREPRTKPPTFFQTNKFTAVYQGLVDTYGVPRYREANPALFTAVTFPFLFGMMYGDMGHAFFLTMASLVLVLKERSLGRAKLDEVMGMAFGGRYMLLMMGICAIYCGFVYNDVFSLPLNLFGSRWSTPNDQGGELTRIGGVDNVYPFGVDPAWKVSENELTFLNSLKMKMSVIFGIVHMTGGICLKLANAVHFRSGIDFFFEGLPQLLFMLSLFGYMAFTIIFKWCQNYNTNGMAPPSLINTLIYMVLSPTAVDTPLYSGQVNVQLVLLAIAGICVPLMLVPKPVILIMRHNAHARAHHPLPRGDEEASLGGGKSSSAAASAADDDAHGPPHEEHTAGELFIHQAIETIEFVLGAVSNTASYLRLWALSLAHSELAKVFWEKAMISTITLSDSTFVNAVAVFLGFGAFCGITLFVLLLMDVLECFLHALRLHWVEFQNKFYKADGVRFDPFDLRAALTQRESTA